MNKSACRNRVIQLAGGQLYSERSRENIVPQTFRNFKRNLIFDSFCIGHGIAGKEFELELVEVNILGGSIRLTDVAGSLGLFMRI